MKINFSEVPDCFLQKQVTCHGEECILIRPKLKGVVWTKDNLIFRSSIWDKKGYPVSLGFKKFFNFGEYPNISPVPISLEGCKIVDKLDGSLLIVSQRNNQVHFRTRGAADIGHCANGSEISYLFTKYERFFKSLTFTNEESTVFEWVSPRHKIIIDYPEPDLYLIGIIKHANYTLYSQKELDDIADAFTLKRPTTTPFRNNLSQLINAVQNVQDAEGIVLYSNNDQTLHKIKSFEYLKKHAARSDVDSLWNIFILWCEWNMLDYNGFYNRMIQEFDYEIAQMALKNIKVIYDTKTEVELRFKRLQSFAEEVKTKYSTRKEQVQYIQNSSFNGHEQGVIFSYLSGQPDDRTIKRWMKILFEEQKYGI